MGVVTRRKADLVVQGYFVETNAGMGLLRARSIELARHLLFLTHAKKAGSLRENVDWILSRNLATV